MTAPSLPKGIYRDDTIHDRLYYTRAQMLAYGELCKGVAPKEQPIPRKCVDEEYNGDFGALFRGFAMGGKK